MSTFQVAAPSALSTTTGGGIPIETGSSWKFILLSIFLIVVIVASITYIVYKGHKLSTEEKVEIGPIKSFSGFYCPPQVSGAGSIGCGEQYLVTSENEPLITCPIGEKINIIGAYFEVYDPFQQCSTTPTQDLLMKCASDPSYISCINSSGASGGWTVPACQPTGTGGCVSRDSSAFLQAFVDGCSDTSNCHVPINTEAFGPFPCDPSGVATSSSQFGLLPLIQGTMGTRQTNSERKLIFSSVSDPIAPATNQGYYVHGIYRCVPK